MNLDTFYGWCNSKCMMKVWSDREYNEFAYSFLEKVQAEGVTWGGIWQEADPVHLDDRLGTYHSEEWEDLYKEIQPNCQELTNI